MFSLDHPNIRWIRKGNTGCTFATLFAKNPECIGWKRYPFWFYTPERAEDDNALIVSITFPERWTTKEVRWWAMENGFFEEMTSDNTVGLRYKCEEGVSWVQYFGKDSHVKTRQAPVPMLMFTRKLNTKHYIKVGWKGVLHLAHAWCSDVKENVYDLLWDQSYKQTCKLLGHKPTIVEAAKTTFYDKGTSISNMESGSISGNKTTINFKS